MIRFFINRPIFAGVVSIIITLLGGLAIFSLPIAQFPEITPPTVQVSATYTGANAEVVSKTVATPIEQQVNGAEQMQYMSSISANDGSMKLTVTFEVGRDLDMATVDVQNRVSLAESTLPNEVTRQGLSIKKQSPNILTVVNLTSPDDTYDSLFLTNYASINLSDALSRLKGVGSVTVYGGGDYSMRIWLDPTKLSDRQLSVSDVINAIQEQNVQAPAGQVGMPPTPPGQEFQYSVRVQGRLDDVNQFQNIIIRSNPDGTTIRLKDLGTAEMGADTYGTFSRLNGKDTCSILIYQLPGANALETMDLVRGTMKEMSNKFPQDLEYHISYDTTRFVQVSIEEVMTTLYEALVLVLLVVFIFLQNWRATLIPMITVPVSLIGTFAMFTVLDFSINTLSLFAIVLAIGLVVDDAIVVVEAVQRIIDEKGCSAKEASILAMKEVSGAVVATSLVLIAVFVPVSFMGGITGRMYEQFAITLSVSVAISTINALTLSPALCALLLGPAKEGKGPLKWFFRGFNKMFDVVTRGYLFGVRSALRFAFITLAVLLVLVFSTWGLMERIPTGFIPEEDQGYFLVTVQLPPAASVERNNEVMKKIEEYFANADGVTDYLTIGGMNMLNSSTSSYNSSMFIILKPWDERTTPDLSVDAILGKAFMHFRNLPEAVVIAFNPPAISGLGAAGGFTFELQDKTGGDIKDLAKVAQDFIAEASKRPELTRMFTSFSDDVPQLEVEVDREKAKTKKVTISDIFTTLQTFLGGYYVNDFNKFGRTYKVMVQAAPQFRANPGQIETYYVRSSTGEMVPLSTLVTIKNIQGPEYVQHFNLYQTVEINGDAAPGYTSGQALQALKEVAAEHLPDGYGFSWSGMSYEEARQGNQAVISMALAVLMVFLLLSALYESWFIPIAVLLAVPLGVLGAMLGLLMMGLENNVYAQIGLVMLIGLVAKNAILIVEFAMMRHEQGLSILDATLEAAHLRFRPILMTAFAFIFGTLPLVIATGAGAASRHCLGTSVFWGMIVATALGVFFTPVSYRVIQGFSKSKRES